MAVGDNMLSSLGWEEERRDQTSWCATKVGIRLGNWSWRMRRR